MKKVLFTLCSALLLLWTAGCAAPEKKCVSIAPPHLKLMLPEVIYAVPGIESNIYYENVIDSATPKAYAVEIKCAKGYFGEKRWFWTPDKADAGKTFDLEMRLFNDYGKVMTANAKVVVAKEPADYKRPTTLALLAASGVGCGYPRHLLKVMREAGFVNYTPVGSHAGGGKPVVKGGVAHDGYGGFSWGSFLSRWYYSEEELPQAQNKAEREQMIALGVLKAPKTQAYRMRSPLLRIVNGKKVLDIPAWLKKVNQGKAPDFIVIQLGGNYMFVAMENTMDSTREKAIKNARTLLTALRKHAPDTVIGVATSLCGCGQDGFAANYKSFQSKFQFRRNIQSYNRGLAALLKELKDPKIKLIPLHQSIDPEGSYIQRSYPVHARSTKKVLRDSNALHAGSAGGAQLGDAIYCWLRKELEQ
jgi:lysophospholipase L1-like esterase